MMLYCARCQDATLSIDLNGHPAHVCPQCGAVYAHRYGKIYSMIADLHGAQSVKDLLHAIGPCRKEATASARACIYPAFCRAFPAPATLFLPGCPEQVSRGASGRGLEPLLRKKGGEPP